jgi:hypothetical protein
MDTEFGVKSFRLRQRSPREPAIGIRIGSYIFPSNILRGAVSHSLVGKVSLRVSGIFVSNFQGVIRRSKALRPPFYPHEEVPRGLSFGDQALAQ